MKFSIKFDASQVNKMIKSLKKEFKESDQGAEAGYLAGDRHKDKDGKEQPLISDIALWNEFGTDKIPSRPFLRNAHKKIGKMAREVVDNGIDAGKTLNQIIREVGEGMRNEIINSIDKGEFEPNAPSTIAKKKSTKPLVDTGQLMGSVHAATFKNGREKLIKDKKIDEI